LGGNLGTILVTGGAGYIGSHTVKVLTRAGRQVVVYDNLSAGHPEAVRGTGLVVGDIADVAKLRGILRQHDVTAVLHFAAWLSVGDSVRDPIGYYRNNVGGALAVLEAMSAEGVSQFVLSSTCAVYGEPVATPMTEAHPTKPINAYGETKLAIERALWHFERAYGMRSVCLRYFNAAGADPDGELGEDHRPEIHLIPRAIDAARGGPPLEIFGHDYPTPDGTCLRDYVHVTDLAEAHVCALTRLEGGGSSGSFNLGNGRPHSVLDVVGAVERAGASPVPVIMSPRREGDPAVLFASVEAAARDLGWRPHLTDLDAIARTAWRWHAAHPHGYGRAAE
jgi:UDP-glucose-4-epimerase GalE